MLSPKAETGATKARMPPRTNDADFRWLIRASTFEIDRSEPTKSRIVGKPEIGPYPAFWGTFADLGPKSRHLVMWPQRPGLRGSGQGSTLAIHVTLGTY